MERVERISNEIIEKMAEILMPYDGDIDDVEIYKTVRKFVDEAMGDMIENLEEEVTVVGEWDDTKSPWYKAHQMVKAQYTREEVDAIPLSELSEFVLRVKY